jgi:cytoskeletal protein CcmA (bactofilin family)
MGKNDQNPLGKKQENEIDRRGKDITTTFGKETAFNGFLKFRDTLKIQGNFKGTIEATGALIVDKDAVVEASRISVASLTVLGTVIGNVIAVDKIDLYAGSILKGDIQAARLRIADGVSFEGTCKMTGIDEDVEIFSRPTEEIKAELQRGIGS